jgi:uncharacterized protein YutE (UPF0331/DUF86 family)
VVDEQRVVLLLQRVTEQLSYLHARAEEDSAERRADEVWLSGLKYRFVTAIEGVVNVAQHVCASEGWGPPKDNGDSLRVLARHGALPAELAERLALAVGFRNLLVHQYAEIDDDLVLGNLDHIGDLDAFVAAVSSWVRDQPAG